MARQVNLELRISLLDEGKIEINPLGNLSESRDLVLGTPRPATAAVGNTATGDVMERRSKELHSRVLKLGRLVESSITRSITALTEQDKHLAEAVIKEDEQIDRMEVELEAYCISILEQVRPVGDDLRFVVAVLKINDCLERIGDLAENIAEAVRKVDNWDGFGRVPGCTEMAQRSQSMLKRSLEALVNRDTKLARRVIDDDHFINEMRGKLEKKIAYAIDNSTASAGPLLRLEHVTRQLERIGDLATNIAEDVVFMIEGQIVRHPNRFDGDDSVVLDLSDGRFRRVT